MRRKVLKSGEARWARRRRRRRAGVWPSTQHSHHPSPLHSFIPGLKPSFSANPSQRNLPVLLPD